MSGIAAPEASPGPRLEVSPGPHIARAGLTTRRMMLDVLIALAPVTAVSIYLFRWHAILQIAIGVLGCSLFELLFARMRGRPSPLGDLSAAVTGLILALSLPWSAPWYVGLVGSLVAVGIGKVVFGGLGQNIFNPAMVGRAFVMVCFPAALGAAAYQMAGDGAAIVTQATPLTAAKQLGQSAPLWPLLVGTVNGSLGETSALGCLLGGIYLCLRRTAAWRIPLGIIAAAALLGGIQNLAAPASGWTVLHHLAGGALLFGAFFIATDPVTSPLSPRGMWIYGIGIGAMVMFLRAYSGYPEGVVAAVLLLNGATPLIDRFTIPRPVGGPVPARR